MFVVIGGVSKLFVIVVDYGYGIIDIWFIDNFDFGLRIVRNV